MKKLAKFALLGFIAWLFTACGTTTAHNLVLQLDTQPQGAEIICDGKSLGFSPLVYNQAVKQDWVFDNDIYKKQKDTTQNLPSCKAQWASDYVDFYPMQAKISDFTFVQEGYYNNKIKVRNYLLTKTLARKSGKGYELDKLAESRFKKIMSATNFDFKVYPKGGQVLCNGNLEVEHIRNALKTGIFQIPQCKAVFVSGYEQFFKNSINIDTQDITTLTNQSITRPNTAGYAQDMQYALEVEKKEILEENERVRTQAAQVQAQAAQEQAKAARRAAAAAQQQANQAALNAVNNSIQQNQQNLQNQQRNFQLQQMNNNLQQINRTLRGY